MLVQRSLRVWCGAVVLLLAAQAQGFAQTIAPSSARTSVPASQALATRLYIPDLPPLQRPALPEIQEETRLVLKLGERRVYVYQGDELKASYPVAVGRAGWETPTGSFHILSMVRNPGWTNPFTGEVIPPGPDNPLGERWIAFWTDGSNYIGFHGTPNPESVGRAASHGCIRMYNQDVRKLFDMVSVGTTVTVEH